MPLSYHALFRARKPPFKPFSAARRRFDSAHADIALYCAEQTPSQAILPSFRVSPNLTHKKPVKRNQPRH